MSRLEGDDRATVALHADAAVPDGVDIGPPIHVTSTYDRRVQDELVYRRSDHPTTERFEAVVGALEHGHAVAYPSGMAAVLAILRLGRPQRVALPDDVYHGVRSLVTAEAAAGALQLVPPTELRTGDLWWVETPSNPKCLISDIEAIAADAHGRGVSVAVDSTFATPVLQQPLQLGADFVMHSATKFIAGHSDAMGGVIAVNSSDDADALRFNRMQDGATPGALDVWLALRGIRTLPLRIARQSESASSIAAWLAERVPRVWHPSQVDHPGHSIAARQMSGPGGVLSFEVATGENARSVVDRLELFRRATSLGGVESLAEWRRSVNPNAPEGLVRLSVGLEAPTDLIADLDQALR